MLLFLFHFRVTGLISYCLHRKISPRQTWSRASWILPSAISNESQQQLHQQRSTHQGSFNVTFLFKCVNISVFLHPSCVLDTSGSVLLQGFPILLWGFFGLTFFFILYFLRGYSFLIRVFLNMHYILLVLQQSAIASRFFFFFPPAGMTAKVALQKYALCFL